jgi:type IV pilus assembly protein PilW
MRAAHQRGFTLLELMIAMTIGLFLAAGLITVVQTNKVVFLNQNQLEQMQDSQRMAMTMMTDVIQSAGYFPQPWSNSQGGGNTLSGTLLAASGTFGTFSDTQAITGQFNAAPPGDTITVRYMTAPQDGILNCSGLSNTNAVGGANVLYYNTFAVVPGPNGTGGQLDCTVTVGGTPTVYQLVNGVTSLSVMYGVKTLLGAPGNNVDTYKNASQMSPTDWQNIISVQILLTFLNPLYTGAGQGQQQFITIQRVVDIMSQAGPGPIL